MILVLSCPLKKLLQNNYVSNSSATGKIGQTNNIQGSIVDYHSTDNCLIVTKEIFLVKTDLSKQINFSDPLYLTNITRQPGFDINYFLSGVSYDYTHLVSYHYSTLPLFLQHLRLRI